ncbi:hypothetical protein BH10ACT6_BH10ACT6_03720 [soil metagenome]
MASKKKQSSAAKKAVDATAKKLQSAGKGAEKLSKKQIAKAKEAAKKATAKAKDRAKKDAAKAKDRAKKEPAKIKAAAKAPVAKAPVRRAPAARSVAESAGETVISLRAKAKALGLTGYSRLSKTQLAERVAARK